ncbi:hypothetical protein BO78DRAFT_424494 [Aspergillus sclerotiicarbonarius CBS 121057]|uniref:Uncharacterized protein n=1 Tax=Aspergillus sclerotiicarbonarius (strain CBS 121057 / IBT 28362) TaxID=1448318 RepID=A0A319DRW6_ASPSB|nr:hypothetical protein BO78DRAFT_424494 [Aspergillus sclerotiicarbonarius CBS 121057]
MSNPEDPNIRRVVSRRISEAGPNMILAIIDASKSSQMKRAENRARREAQKPSTEVNKVCG